MATIQDIRYELADTDVNFPILSDAEITYYLTKNSTNLARTSMDCARAILMKLSMRSEDTIDIFSMKSAKTANQYMLALQLYIKDPNLNPLMQNLQGYAGGVSISDMQANAANSDNNRVIRPSESGCSLPLDFFG